MHIKVRQQRKTQRIRLIHRQEMWTLTAQGWAVTITLAATLIIFLITHIHPFLAVTHPLKADALVVEGWMSDYALEQAFTELESGDVRQIITTGGPLEKGHYLAEYKNFAELTAASLKARGLNKEKLVAVPTPEIIRDRTYTSAVTFRKWLLNSNSQIKAINLYTFDVHARRSWLIYKKVLAPKIKVGVIAAKPLDYDPNHWWSSSAGVRQIMSETIGYIYARFVNWSA